MPRFLGLTPVTDLTRTPFAEFTPADWALEYINRYGQIHGDHHKAWVLDQVARILHGTPVLVRLARWDDGTEDYRFDTGVPSADYLEWRKETEDTGYEYEEGVAP